MRARYALRGVLVPVIAVLVAFLLGAILIVLTDFEHLQHLGTDPAGALAGALGGVVEGYGAMLAGAVGDPGRIATAIGSGDAADVAAAIRPITEGLLSATPLIFAGLGVAIAFHAGLFNLGATGQFLMGSMGAAITAIVLVDRFPPPLILAVALLGGTLAGAAYGFVPGILKARTGAHEVITTLMLTSIAPQILFLVGSSFPYSGSLATIAAVPLLFDLPTIRLDFGIVAAALMAAVVSFILLRTTIGFELRATGFGPRAARSAGIRPGVAVTLAMTLSGGLVGMGGAFFTLGPAAGVSLPSRDFGFVALAIAMIAGLRPSGVVLAAIFYGALITGAKDMVIVSGIPLALLTFVIAAAMLLVATPGLIRAVGRTREAVPAADPPGV